VDGDDLPGMGAAEGDLLPAIMMTPALRAATPGPARVGRAAGGRSGRSAPGTRGHDVNVYG
jgi:hypothetical protein